MNEQELKQKLREPFPSSQIEWRASQVGAKNKKPWVQCLAYITNRAAMDRLDDVFGVYGWKNEFRDIPNDGVECTISVWDESKQQWIAKTDAAHITDIEEVKGGRSNAMKRAVVQLGIGRYLYDLTANFGQVLEKREQGAIFQKGKQGQYDSFYWKPPRLPEWALPKSNNKTPAPKKKSDPSENTQSKTDIKDSDEYQELMEKVDEAVNLNCLDEKGVQWCRNVKTKAEIEKAVAKLEKLINDKK